MRRLQGVNDVESPEVVRQGESNSRRSDRPVVVGLDFGRRRIGVAATDPLGIGIYPVGVVVRRSQTQDLQALEAMVAERDAGRVVVGLPLNFDGTEGPSARSARRFAEHLSQTLDIPVEMHDERLTTFEARERLKVGYRSRSRRRANVDALAAVVILEGWLAFRSQAGA
jgi:putative Holliday junction resolvase